MTVRTSTTTDEKLDLDDQVYPPESGLSPLPEYGNILDFFLLLAKNKALIFRITLICTLLGIVGSLLIRNIYTAQSRILPPQQNQSAMTALMGFSGLLGKDFGLKSSSDLYVSFLRSRTVSDALVKRFDLKAVYKKSKVVEARDKLRDNSEITASKDGVVTIAVDDREPWRAAALANAYVDELYKLNQTLVVTEAGQRRVFFEKELILAKDNLSNAEVALKKTQEQTGLIQIDAQAQAIIEGIARLRAQISAKEVQLQSLGSFATNQNASVLRAQQELTALKSQLQTAERSEGGGNGDIQLPTGTIPRAGLEYVRKLRDVRYYETLFEMMARQFELAKIDEAKSAPLIQVLDSAVTPEKKSKPPRLIIVAVALFTGFLLSILWVLGREMYQRAEEDPATKGKINSFKHYLALRS